jgi:hypothetical protein
MRWFFDHSGISRPFDFGKNKMAQSVFSLYAYGPYIRIKLKIS